MLSNSIISLVIMSTITSKKMPYFQFYGLNVIMNCLELVGVQRQNENLMRAFNRGITLDSMWRNDTDRNKISVYFQCLSYNVPINCIQVLGVIKEIEPLIIAFHRGIIHISTYRIDKDTKIDKFCHKSRWYQISSPPDNSPRTFAPHQFPPGQFPPPPPPRTMCHINNM